MSKRDCKKYQPYCEELNCNKCADNQNNTGEQPERKIGKCTLTNEELKAKIADWVDRFCKTGGRAWSLRVPVDFNHDPDMVILELANRFTQLEEAIEHLKQVSVEANNTSYVDESTIMRVDTFLKSIEQMVDSYERTE